MLFLLYIFFVLLHFLLFLLLLLLILLTHSLLLRFFVLLYFLSFNKLQRVRDYTLVSSICFFNISLPFKNCFSIILSPVMLCVRCVSCCLCDCYKKENARKITIKKKISERNTRDEMKNKIKRKLDETLL